MVTITFTYYALLRSDGQHEIHLYLSRLDPTWTETPFKEHKAMKDAAQVVRDIVHNNTGDDRLLLRNGNPPANAIPVFMFAVGVSWNREKRCAHYSRVCHQRYLWDSKWNPVASLGMEQCEYTMSVLRKRENIEVSRNSR